MGKGDKKSRRGKIHIGSHGARRPRKKSNSVPGTTVPKASETDVKLAAEVVKKAAKAAPVKPVAEPAPKPVKAPKAVAEKEEVATETAEVKKAPRKTTKKAKE